MRNINNIQQFLIDDGRIIFINPIYSVENKTQELQKIQIFRHLRPALVHEEMARLNQINSLIASSAPSTAIGGSGNRTDLTQAPFTTGGPAPQKSTKGAGFNFKSWKHLKRI